MNNFPLIAMLNIELQLNAINLFDRGRFESSRYIKINQGLIEHIIIQ